MKYQKESVKELTQKSVQFHLFGPLIESTALLIFREAAHIIQHSFAILSYQVYLTEFLCILEENHLEVYTSTWTIHVRMMQGGPLNVFTQKIQRIPQPAYNPNLAPCDFFLFDYIKRKLIEYDPDQQSLKSVITHIFGEIRQETLIAVFETWINRIKWVIEHEG